MNQGNALVGLLLVGALAAVYPVAAAIIGGLILCEILLRRALPAGVRMLLNSRGPLQNWRRVPLAQKNMARATFGGFVVALSIGLAVTGFPVIGVRFTAGIAAFGLLYLVAGACGSQGARFDVISVFWWGVGALGCAAGLLYLKGVI